MSKSKKIVKIIVAVIISLFVTALITAALTVCIRGNIKNETLPENFDESLSQVSCEKEENDVRIMTSNLLVHYKSWGGSDAHPRAKMFFSMLDTYKPDVIGLQEVSDQWYSILMMNKGNYKILYPVTAGITLRMTGLMYNSDTLELIDKGEQKFSQGNDARLRRMVWGIFKNKATGEEFAVISTHFDTIRPNEEELMLSYMKTQIDEIEAKSTELKTQYKVPVFSIGDFNSKPNGDGVDEIMDVPEIYYELCEKLTDTKNIAIKTQSGKVCSVNTPTWDHIFIDGEANINQYVLLSSDALSNMSDHYPVFVDVNFSNDGNENNE